ncbi:MAG: hypothetical protein PHG95_01380 [Patescibacteria group bacterium]|nr:hypothetical protein [Patescibacteria group bacterium]
MNISLSKKIRIFWLILLFFIIIFLAYQFISPGGDWNCEYSFSSLRGSSCLGEAAPSERAIKTQGGPLLILGEPVYFSVFSPRRFSHVTVQITYRPHLSSSTPIFEAGFLADKKLWRYRLQPVYNLWLEQGLSSWTKLSSGDLRLFQRENKFSSVSEFISAWQNQGSSFCSRPRCLAVYNVSLEDAPPALDLRSLSQSSEDTIFPYPLRGEHQFYIFLDKQGLSLSGNLIDLNENKDIDDAEILIFSGKNQVASLSLPDERPQKEESGDQVLAQPIKIVNSDLPAGLYRLEFRAGDDLILSDLSVNSSYLSVINKIWPFTENEVSLVTDAPYLQVKALSPAALQTLDFGGRRLELTEIYKQYELKGARWGGENIRLNTGSLILANNGMFAASSSALINPDYPRLDRFSSLDGQLDFVLANYRPATINEDAWLSSTLEFEAFDLYRERGRYSLILSIPGLLAEGGGGGSVEIKSINVEFSGASLIDKIKDWLHL